MRKKTKPLEFNVTLPIKFILEEEIEKGETGSALGGNNGVVYKIFAKIGKKTYFRGFLNHAEKGIFGHSMHNVCLQLYSDNIYDMGEITFNAKNLEIAVNKIAENMLKFQDEIE